MRARFGAAAFAAWLVLGMPVVAQEAAKPKTPELKPVPEDKAKQLREMYERRKAAREGDQVPAPDDVAAPPPSAERLPSGLATRVLRPGTGEQKPTANDWVLVHYTAWTTDGKMFDTTVHEAHPVAFQVRKAIAGLSEGLQKMVVGERRRLWIPDTLAFKDDPKKPQGMLVYEIELQEIILGPVPPAAAELKAAPEHATRTATGLAYRTLETGRTGEEKPLLGDVVTVHYSTWDSTGKLLDTTLAFNTPATLTVGETVKGLDEALQLVHPGSSTRLWMPREMAKLDAKTDIPGQGDLVFDVRLISVMHKPVTPPDVAAPPEGAQRTPGGVAYKVLKPGRGEKHPQPDATVRVEYAGWTSDGKLFDSSFAHGQPKVTKVTMGKEPKGWNEALTQMTVGERRRLWIPPELAFSGRPDRPQGTLVFDVELLEIQE